MAYFEISGGETVIFFEKKEKMKIGSSSFMSIIPQGHVCLFQAAFPSERIDFVTAYPVFIKISRIVFLGLKVTFEKKIKNKFCKQLSPELVVFRSIPPNG